MSDSEDIILDIRGFSRFYTNVLGLLDQHILDSGYSLTEARVIFEISKTECCSANMLVHQLGIDRSYMSRIILKFERNGIITKTASTSDNRVNYIQLTDKGWHDFNTLSEKSNEQIKKLIDPLSEDALVQVQKAMNTIKRNLSIATESISIRPFTENDVEYVISRHKTLYQAERNLSSVFCEYVDESIRKFVKNFDAKKECMYILACNSNPVGCIAIVKADEKTAQLRYFLLESEMRGRGLGHQLVDMALDFCRNNGYRHVFLLTISAQKAARHIYESKGFKITETHQNIEWGKDVLEERWDLDLDFAKH